MCVELEISRARLTMLTKEYCGLTAAELVDGMKVRELRKHMMERMREAAYALWGTPGAFAAEKYNGFATEDTEDTEKGTTEDTEHTENGQGIWDRGQGLGNV